MLVQSTQRDFNTLSLITDEGVTAPNVTWIYDSLVSQRSEEMSSFYGWLADGLGVAPTNEPSSFACIPGRDGTTVFRSLPGT